MRQSHIADAQIAENAHHADVIPDHVPAFDAHQRRNFPLRMSAAHLCCGPGKHHILRELAHIFMDRVDLI